MQCSWFVNPTFFAVNGKHWINKVWLYIDPCCWLENFDFCSMQPVFVHWYGGCKKCSYQPSLPHIQSTIYISIPLTNPSIPPPYLSIPHPTYPFPTLLIHSPRYLSIPHPTYPFPTLLIHSPPYISIPHPTYPFPTLSINYANPPYPFTNPPIHSFSQTIHSCTPIHFPPLSIHFPPPPIHSSTVPIHSSLFAAWLFCTFHNKSHHMKHWSF